MDQRSGVSNRARIVWKPEMPVAPHTMAFKPLMDGSNVGRLRKMPDWRKGCDEELMAEVRYWRVGTNGQL